MADTLPKIVKRMTGFRDEPYYSIEYENKQTGKIHIGYSSYDLEIVRGYMKEYFGIEWKGEVEWL